MRLGTRSFAHVGDGGPEVWWLDDTATHAVSALPQQSSEALPRRGREAYRGRTLTLD